MSLRVALLQTAGHPGDPDRNLADLRGAAHRAATGGAGLLLTTELFLTGYDIGDAIHDLAARDLLTPVRRIAEESGVALVVGAPELADGTLYNSAYFVAPDGTHATYRKAHLFGDLDRRSFAAGDAPFVAVEYRGIRIAMMICYDVEFPETVRAAAWDGAHLVAVPTAQMTPFAYVAEEIVRARAWENQVYVAYCNHVGTEGSTTYVGRSSIVGPDATVLAAGGPDDEILLIADVDPAVVTDARRANPYLLDRRPELY